MGICIIGHFGGGRTFNDGQTIKTRTIYEALKAHNIADVDRVDTYYVKRNPLRFLYQLVSSAIRDKKYIVLLSSNGRRVLFPVLSWMSRVLQKDIYHYVIGGRLAKQARDNERWRRYISSFQGNWVESTLLVDQLQAIGVKNAVYIPNFKNLRILSREELPADYSEPFRLCTFSRVIPEKGIEDAVRAVRSINGKAGSPRVTLDIYGPVPGEYAERFRELLEQSRDCRYRGTVEPNKSVEALKDYYALLFPTYWPGEGLPGTIIDALSAGLPVIAREWTYCGEILTHMETGYIYGSDQPEKLEDTIVYAVTHVKETAAMKPACLRKAVQFSEPYVLKRILHEMGLPECQ